jgi:hypothetical protein
MAKGLSCSIKAAIEEGSLKDFTLHGLNPPIYHDQFVDDTMMMGSITAREARRILEILNDFSEASDTSINTEKSQIFFFNTPWVVQTYINRILSFSQSSLSSKDLGVPLINNALRNSSWEGLLASLEKRLNS